MKNGKKMSDGHCALFVYGTLRKGFPNHFLLEGAAFGGAAKTKERYALYVDRIPYVTRAAEISGIIGEVFEVNRVLLERIDRLEGHPRWYHREEVAVVMEHGKELSAWMYFNKSPRGRVVESGDYAECEDLMVRRA